MIPLARMERGCPQSGRGRGREIVSCDGYIHGTPNGVLMHRLNSYKTLQSDMNKVWILLHEILESAIGDKFRFAKIDSATHNAANNR